MSFIETSALDASNVELAFQNILTGILNLKYILCNASGANMLIIEIYQIVSAKALDSNESGPTIGDRSRVLEISKQADPPKNDGKCC